MPDSCDQCLEDGITLQESNDGGWNADYEYELRRRAYYQEDDDVDEEKGG